MEKIPGTTLGVAFDNHEFESPSIQVTLVSVAMLVLAALSNRTVM